MIFGPKKFRVKKKFVFKNIWVLKIFDPKKVWVKKLWSKIFWIKRKLWVKKKLGLESWFLHKKKCPKNVQLALLGISFPTLLSPVLAWFALSQLKMFQMNLTSDDWNWPVLTCLPCPNLSWLIVSQLELSQVDLKNLTCPDFTCRDLNCQDLNRADLTFFNCSILTWLELLWPVLTCSVLIGPSDTSRHPIQFGHPTDTLKTPSRQPPHTLQTPSRHTRDTLQTPSRHPPNTHWTSTKFQTFLLAETRLRPGIMPVYE